MNFWLGTHETSWLGKLDVPLMVSHRRLVRRVALPRARAPWVLDSGGFTELNLHGRWETTEAQYAEAVEVYAEHVGQLAWAAPMDWMCEPFVLAKTGLSVAAHQHRTVENYCRLTADYPHLPFIPVLQGWERDDYERCAGMYQKAGVDLFALPVIGLGTVCRRQHTAEGKEIVGALWRAGLKLHGFGLKSLGLADYGRWITSADSLAWSYNARRHPPIEGHSHKSCANCPEWALRWRDRVLAGMWPQSPTLDEWLVPA